MGEVTKGLPPELVTILRDQSIVIPQDGAVWALAIYTPQTAPCNTASATIEPDPMSQSENQP